MADRVASLPMYDLPELRAVTDAWWTGLARHFRAAGVDDIPGRPTRPGEGTAFWQRPDLLLSQSCGYPVATVLSDKIQVVATPCYRFPGCDGPYYSSTIIVAADADIPNLADLRGRRCAVNMRNSWSGHHALRMLPAVDLTSGGVVISGGHRTSIAMVAGGEADFAAIDCVTYGLLSRHAPAEVAGVRVLDMTPLAPGLPMIAGLAVGEDELTGLRSGLHAAMEDPALDEVRRELGLAGLADLTLSDYLPLSMPAAGASESAGSRRRNDSSFL